MLKLVLDLYKVYIKEKQYMDIQMSLMIPSLTGKWQEFTGWMRLGGTSEDHPVQHPCSCQDQPEQVTHDLVQSGLWGQ